MPTKAADLTGEKFGKWTVLSEADPIRYCGKPRRRLFCKCDCGSTAIVRQSSLASGRSQACLGCGRSSANGMSVQYRIEYGIWQKMIRRCHNSADKSFRYYGARGISVCDEWRFGNSGRQGFECFIAAVGRRPNPSLSIDRIDNDGNYEPGNVRWATSSQQNSNKRKRVSKQN